jgi:hypothetical protein
MVGEQTYIDYIFEALPGNSNLSGQWCDRAPQASWDRPSQACINIHKPESRAMMGEQTWITPVEAHG